MLLNKKQTNKHILPIVLAHFHENKIKNNNTSEVGLIADRRQAVVV